MTNTSPYCSNCGHVFPHHHANGPCGTKDCPCPGFNSPKPISETVVHLPVVDDRLEPKKPAARSSTESNLVAHAIRELDIVNSKVHPRDRYSDHEINGFIKVIQAFADMGHSGGSAPMAIGLITDLLQFKPLTALTDNPDEWIFHTEEVWGAPDGIWQSTRNSEAFSMDGGKTYYLLSEVRNGTAGDGRTRIMHNALEVSPDPEAAKARKVEADAAPYDR